MAIAFPRNFPWWILPVISATTWVGSITGMLIHWATTGRPRYASQVIPEQTLPYISDIAACDPVMTRVFFAACVITTVCLDIGFLADRWLRHRAIISRKDTWQQQLVVCFSLLFMAVSTVGVIMLNIFGTLKYPVVHRYMDLLFMLGTFCTAVFFVWEYFYLKIRERGVLMLYVSFYLKMSAIAINVCTFTTIVVVQIAFKEHENIAVIAEWCAAPTFSVYILSHALDLKLAMRGYFNKTPAEVSVEKKEASSADSVIEKESDSAMV